MEKKSKILLSIILGLLFPFPTLIGFIPMGLVIFLNLKNLFTRFSLFTSSGLLASNIFLSFIWIIAGIVYIGITYWIINSLIRFKKTSKTKFYILLIITICLLLLNILNVILNNIFPFSP